MSKNPVEKLSGLAVITGASTGIGFEIAKLVAKDGCDLILASDTDHSAIIGEATRLGAGTVEVVQCDLSTRAGTEQLLSAIRGRPVDVLVANAGEGYGGHFLDEAWENVDRTIETNIKSTVALIHAIGGQMRVRGSGRILVTGSIAGHLPGTFNLVYNSTKAFIDDFCLGLAEELRDSPVVLTCLLPGATETEFFKRGDFEDTPMGQASKADPAKVARDGYDALLNGTTQVTSGFMNKVQRVFADILPEELIAKMHRHMFKPRDEKASEPA
jgi:short-subunit dehydrogenase